MLEQGTKLDDRYLILAKIGQGGMSEVYRALDLRLEREVAVKVLKEELLKDDESSRRFNQEARAAASLAHPNIVVTYDIVDSGEYHYIVMELVEGITLKKYIEKKGMLKSRETIGIAIQAALGIGEAHKNGIVHRDIKPQNIIISRDGKIKVSDFGIALIAADEMDESELLMGSAHYIAPEQVEQGVADTRSDIYSLGITMYEMLTAMTPFSGENADDIAMKHVEDALVPPIVYNPSVFPSLNEIVLKCLRKNPEERYSSMDELVADLRRSVREPEGHFVRQFDVSPFPASIGESGDSASKRLHVYNDELLSSEQGFSEAGEDDTRGIDSDETGAIDTHASGHMARNVLLIAGIVLFAAVLACFSVVMLRKASRKRAEFETETGILIANSAAISETEMNYTISIEGEDLVPDVTGLNIDQARARLSEYQLSMDSSSTEYSDTYEKGLIIRQNPAAGELFSIGTTVYVTSSRGSVLDDIRDDTPEEAIEKLTDEGFVMDETVETSFSDEIAEGRVAGFMLIDQAGDILETAAADEDESVSDTVTDTYFPPVERDHFRRYMVRLIVSLGSESSYTVMEDLLGLSTDEASSRLLAAGLSEGSVTTVHSGEYPFGAIVAQSVPAGEYRKLGESVDFSVSVGADSPIPDGTDFAEVSAASHQGESGGEQPELSPDYYYGHINTTCVISPQSPLVGSQELNVSIRLRQFVNGGEEYTHIFGPIIVTVSDEIPISFRNIRGAWGVDEGYVEVYCPDTGEIFSTYKISFSAIE